MTRDERYIYTALEQAKEAFLRREIAVGAVVVHNDKVISSGYNLRETTSDPLAHAEIVAIRKATEIIGDWRLSNCEIYVTLEPCAMCAGAIIESRFKRVVFGAFDPEKGFFGSKLDLSIYSNVLGGLEVLGGVLEKQCQDLLKSSLKQLRL